MDRNCDCEICGNSENDTGVEHTIESVSGILVYVCTNCERFVDK